MSYLWGSSVVLRQITSLTTIYLIVLPLLSCAYLYLYLQPDKFIPERFLKTSSHYEDQNHRAFMAWGLGPRMCVAADFALNEAKLALITLYKNFHFEHNEAVPLKVAMGASLGPVSGVEVFVHKRSSS